MGQNTDPWFTNDEARRKAFSQALKRDIFLCFIGLHAPEVFVRPSVGPTDGDCFDLKLTELLR